jgi:Response regulator receiver domain
VTFLVERHCLARDPRPDKAQFRDRESAEPCATPLPVLSATLNFPCLTSSRSWPQNCSFCTPGHESGDPCLVTSPTNSAFLPQPRSKPAQRRWSMSVLRLLIADDHEIVRRGLCALLKSHAEWEVCAEAGDGREAVEKAQQLKPDIVILDIAMPNLNGLIAARQILRDPARAEDPNAYHHRRRTSCAGSTGNRCAWVRAQVGCRKRFGGRC